MVLPLAAVAALSTLALSLEPIAARAHVRPIALDALGSALRTIDLDPRRPRGTRGNPALTLEAVQATLLKIGVEPRRGDRGFRVVTSAMEPSLHCARPRYGCLGQVVDRVLVRPYRARAPSRRHVVAFVTPPQARARCGGGRTFIKRVIGLPGERVTVRDAAGVSRVFVDGRRLNEPYASRVRGSIAEAGPVTVPAGHYFVLGDNRSLSCDSAVWGTLPRENIIGRAIAVYWPPARAKRL